MNDNEYLDVIDTMKDTELRLEGDILQLREEISSLEKENIKLKENLSYIREKLNHALPECLHHCPVHWCKGTGILTLHDGACTIRCSDCKIETNSHNTIAAAINEWNGTDD